MFPSASPDLAASEFPCSTSSTPCFMAATAPLVSPWITRIIWPISLVALVVRSARARTSSATTAKPRPCSPARAASMAAFSARRLVWSAISSMVPTISPIWSDRAPRLSTVAADCFTFSAIRFMPATDCCTTATPCTASSSPCRELSAASEQFWAISMEVADISSLAVATVPVCDATSSELMAICSLPAESISAADVSSVAVLLMEVIMLAVDSSMRLMLLPSMPISSSA